MGKLHDLRLSLSMLVKQSYFLDWWISDNSLLSILHNNYNQHNINKSYLNKYINNIGLNTINIFQHKEDKLTNDRRTFFYIFTEENLPPNKLSREEYFRCHSSFCELRSKNDNFNRSNKRKDSSSTQSSVIISPDIKNTKRLQVIKEIGDYFNCPLSKKVFECKLNEDVYDCLSRRIDLLDDVLKNHESILSIMNKGKKMMRLHQNNSTQQFTELYIYNLPTLIFLK